MHAPAKPRILSPKAKARLLWLAVHRWIGVLLLLVFVAMGVTGMALVWRPATERLIHPDRFPAQVQDITADPATLLAAAQAALPDGKRPTEIEFAEPGSAVVITGESNGPPILGVGPPRRPRIWLDPADASVLSVSHGAPDVVFIAKAMHGHLFVAGFGRYLVAFTGLFLIASSVSGFWIWWPGTKNIVASFKWRRPFSRSMNLHRTIAPLVGIGLIVQGTTGILIAQPVILAAFVAADAPAKRGGGPRKPPARPLEAPVQAIGVVLLSASHVAGEAPAALTFPTETSPWSIAFGSGAVVTIDDATGIATITPPAPPAPTEEAREAVMKLHEGGYGAVHQILLFATGLALSTLSITGLFLWLQGRRRRTR